MRSEIKLFEDQYRFFKDMKSKRLLVAFVEFMFEDIEPTDLKWLEKTVFESMRKRMENSKKIHDGNSKGWSNSRWGWRPENTSWELEWENKSKTSQKQVDMQVKNNEEWSMKYEDIKEKEISKDISKKKEIPTPSELVEAYRNTPQLVEKIKDEWVVRQRAEYKQKKKSKAYKTISWFIQQLVENVTTVSNWEIRYDVWERLRYAQNKAIDWDNLWIRRDERMERWFATWKKFNSLTQKQNE